MSVGKLAAAAADRSLTTAAAIVMASFVSSRLLGLVREIVISAQFGTSRSYEAYLAAFRIPDFVIQLLAGGALASAILPVLTARLADGDHAGSWRVASTVFNVAAVLLTTSAVLAGVFAPWLMPLVAPGFQGETFDLAVNLTRLMLVSPVLAGLSCIVMAVLNTHQRFTLPALAPSVYNLCIILGALFLAPAWGVYGLAAGVVVGALLHLLVQLPGLARVGASYRLVLDLANKDVREIARLMLPRTAGLAAVQVNFVVTTAIATTLTAGSLAALNYAWQLMMLPLGVFAIAISTVVFPTLSEQAARKDLPEMGRTLQQWLGVVFYLTLPAAVGLIVLGGPIIALILQRGRFDIESANATMQALQFYAVGLLGHSAIEILTRAYYALHDTRTPVKWGVFSMGLNVVLSLLLAAPLAHRGLAFANALAAVAEATLLIYVLQRRWSMLNLRAVGASVLRSGAAAVVMGLGLAGGLGVVSSWLPPDGWGAAVTVAGGVALGGALYFGVSLLLGCHEVRFMLRSFRGRIPG